MKFFSALVLFVCVSLPVISGCHTGWLEFQEKCYLFAKITDTWSGASSFCQAFHSTMAEPRTAGQQGFLAAELQQQSNIGSLDYWIGVTDIVLENHWEYASDESTVTDLYWGPNEPDGHIGENCVVISASSFGKWHDVVCTTKRHFICEKENSVSGEIIG